MITLAKLLSTPRRRIRHPTLITLNQLINCRSSTRGLKTMWNSTLLVLGQKVMTRTAKATMRTISSRRLSRRKHRLASPSSSTSRIRFHQVGTRWVGWNFQLRNFFLTFDLIHQVLDHDSNILYVALPKTLTHEASKQSFLSLLEFAEEKLDCDGVVLCIRKDRPDRANLVKTFLFLGFSPLNPKSPLAPPHQQGQNDDHLFLLYSIED